MRMTAHKLISIPIGEMVEPGVNLTTIGFIKRPQSHLYRRCGDDFFHRGLRFQQCPQNPDSILTWLQRGAEARRGIQVLNFGTLAPRLPPPRWRGSALPGRPRP